MRFNKVVSLTVALMVALVLAPALRGDETGTTTTPPNPQNGDVQMVTAGKIADDPEEFYDKKVSVRAEVEDVLGPQAFLLDEDRLFVWPDVLVLTPETTRDIPEDEIVTVVGTVRKYVSADLRRTYDWNWWRELDERIEITFDDRPVIMAESVRTNAGVELIKK